MDWSDALTIILGGGLVLAGISALKFRRQKKMAERNEVATFVTFVADALEGMVSELQEGHIPHASGHRFERLLGAYEHRMRPYLSDQVQEDLNNLKDVSERARDMDNDLRRAFAEHVEANGELGIKQRHEESLIQMQRVIGNLRAQADEVKTRPLG